MSPHKKRSAFTTSKTVLFVVISHKAWCSKAALLPSIFSCCTVLAGSRVSATHSLMGTFQAVQASSMEHAGRIPLAFWTVHLKASPAPITCPCRPTRGLLWHSLTQMLPLSTYPILKPFSPNHSALNKTIIQHHVTTQGSHTAQHPPLQGTKSIPEHCDFTSKCHKLLLVLLCLSMENRTDTSFPIKPQTT